MWPTYIQFLKKCISIIFRSTFKVNELGGRNCAGDQILFLCTLHIKILHWIVMFFIVSVLDL